MSAQPGLQNLCASRDPACGATAGFGIAMARSIPALLLALVLVACGQAAFLGANCGAEATLADYRLLPGDRVRVTVDRHEDLSGPFEVGGDGYLATPLLLELRAEGLTARQLEHEMVARFQLPVSIEILRYRPVRFLGEYRPGMTVGDLLGDWSIYRADRDDLRIAREGCMLQGEPDLKLLPGDVITIRERYF